VETSVSMASPLGKALLVERSGRRWTSRLPMVKAQTQDRESLDTVHDLAGS